ncbi:tetratricopeptide repeat protein [Fodinibius sp. SL11]|uniref:type IX secretion system periplasmic lipoprotein PorW/SprE n=1 Tax=Fodinibius sp. SL11 TaxID=3425690 RepID=UPI003F885383
MRKFFLILLTGLFLVGCGSALTSSWNNFTAYYNTFYNARESFKSGLKKVNKQPVTIDPSTPVRIHAAPNNAGYNDFQNAIDKGAQVLRRFSDSKWVDDAILLIGKSYYYRQEFYPALQKFEELMNASTSPKLISYAIIWKGRTQLDLKQYSAGISYLESELEQYPAKWPQKYKGEIQALAGQHHAMLQNWNEGVDYLFDATANINDKALLGRTYFLLGQVLERQGRYGEAFNAFGEVQNNFPDFEYLYWSKFKQADIAREATRFDLALDIFQKLRRDDKNVDRRGRLLFEIAQTYAMSGESKQAEQLLKKLLHGAESEQSRDLKADIYFRLGKIYSDQYNQYQVAAAYFDSSSTIKNASPSGTDTANPSELADTYGQYTELQKSISRADSLLKLGAMSEQELDSALTVIRTQKKQALEDKEGKEEAAIANTQFTEDEETSEIPTMYGYLNYKNRELVSQYKSQFRLRWGERPLVDNWRRAEAIRGAGQQEDVGVAKNDQSINRLGTAESVIEMNLEEIPRTDEQKNQLRIEKANAQYSLGNLLFLNLNMPDSARYYFHKVLKNDIAKELHPQAMYSLFEIFSTENNVDSLQYWGQAIREQFPGTRYARRVEVRLGNSTVDVFQQDTTKTLLDDYHRLVQDTTSGKPAKLRKLALNNRSSDLAPHIFYQSIEAYIEQAKNKTSATNSTLNGFLDNNSSDSLRDDSVTTSALKEPLQFSGAAWDSVRVAIHQFDTTFSNAQLQQRVAKLKQVLEEQQSESQKTVTCEDVGISLRVIPNMDNFLSQVSYPNKLERTSLSGKVTYSFVVTKEGKVQSYELISPNTSLGIEEAFEKAFDEHLQFAPLEVQPAPDEVRCEVSFPIQR